MTSDILYLVLYTVYSLNMPDRHKLLFFDNASAILAVGMWLCTKWQCSLDFDVPYLTSELVKFEGVCCELRDTMAIFLAFL
jgi:hypothetical protein